MNSRAARWLSAHAEQPPAALRARLDTLVNDAAESPDAPVSETLLQAGQGLLGTILGSGSTQRDAALDLLTADALVTYAFEAAAEAPASLDAQAAVAMRAIAAMVDARNP